MTEGSWFSDEEYEGYEESKQNEVNESMSELIEYLIDTSANTAPANPVVKVFDTTEADNYFYSQAPSVIQNNNDNSYLVQSSSMRGGKQDILAFIIAVPELINDYLFNREFIGWTELIKDSTIFEEKRYELEMQLERNSNVDMNLLITLIFFKWFETLKSNINKMDKIIESGVSQRFLLPHTVLYLLGFGVYFRVESTGDEFIVGDQKNIIKGIDMIETNNGEIKIVYEKADFVERTSTVKQLYFIELESQLLRAYDVDGSKKDASINDLLVRVYKRRSRMKTGIEKFYKKIKSVNN